MFRHAGKNFSKLLTSVRRSSRTGVQVRLQSTLPDSRPFWSPSRVFLLTSFTASLTYLYGVNDASSQFKLPWVNSIRPRYGNKKDMEKVGLVLAATDCRLTAR